MICAAPISKASLRVNICFNQRLCRHSLLFEHSDSKGRKLIWVVAAYILRHRWSNVFTQQVHFLLAQSKQTFFVLLLGFVTAEKRIDDSNMAKVCGYLQPAFHLHHLFH